MAYLRRYTGANNRKGTAMQTLFITFAAGALAALGAIAPAQANTELPPPSHTAPNLSGLHDFDFLMGEWRLHHRRLKERLAGCHEWQEFDSTSTASPILGGYGNIDDNLIYLPGDTYRAVTVRTYDPKTGQWAIWWIDGRDPFGNLDPAVKGRFVNGVGTFYSDDVFKGKPIRVRYIWSHITPTSAHWEQAFSPDGGKTWETNWTNDLEKVS
jgi:hypothetical protein